MRSPPFNAYLCVFMTGGYAFVRQFDAPRRPAAATVAARGRENTDFRAVRNTLFFNGLASNKRKILAKRHSKRHVSGPDSPSFAGREVAFHKLKGCFLRDKKQHIALPLTTNSTKNGKTARATGVNMPWSFYSAKFYCQSFWITRMHVYASRWINACHLYALYKETVGILLQK